jgi:hypothetical protein
MTRGGDFVFFPVTNDGSLNVRLPILTIEREAPFFWVSLGLREVHAFGAMVVQNFEGVAIGDGDDGAGKIGSPTTRLICPLKRVPILC